MFRRIRFTWNGQNPLIIVRGCMVWAVWEFQCRAETHSRAARAKLAAQRFYRDVSFWLAVWWKMFLAQSGYPNWRA